jgi:hypothetical protein
MAWDEDPVGARERVKVARLPRAVLGYILTLPERTLRALAAALGGLLYEISLVLFPDWLRHSRLYQALLYRTLRIVIESVGGVEQILPPDAAAERLLMRKTAGNAIEVLGFLALGWSPLWVMAMMADISGGSQMYLQELLEGLKRRGFLAAGLDASSVEELLKNLEDASGQMADLIDIPPLTVQELRRSWEQMKASASTLPDPDRLRRLYLLMREVADQEGRSVWGLSSVLALGAVEAGLRIGETHVIDFYRKSLQDIAEEGVRAYIRRVIQPYQRAVVEHFAPGRETTTGRAIRRIGF